MKVKLNRVTFWISCMALQTHSKQSCPNIQCKIITMGQYERNSSLWGTVVPSIGSVQKSNQPPSTKGNTPNFKLKTKPSLSLTTYRFFHTLAEKIHKRYRSATATTRNPSDNFFAMARLRVEKLPR